MRQVNIGIIGCGYWGPNFVRNFTKITGVKVKYVCDLSSARLIHMKQLYKKIVTTRDYLQILRDEDIDAVVIAVPAAKHFTLVKKALEYNKHVLVEKPIATKVSDAKEIIHLAKLRKKILMVGHTFKFNPGVNKLKWLVQKNKLGRIYYIYSRRTNLGPLRRDVNALWDLAPHDISILNYVINDTPLAVTAKGERYLPHKLEDICFSTLTYPNRILANVHVSWLDPKKVRETIIVGSKKMAIFDDLNVNSPVSVYDKSVVKKRFKQSYDSFKEFQMIIKDGKVDFPKIRQQEPLLVECRHFIDCVKNNIKPLTDGNDGLEVLKVLIGIQKSLKNNGAQVKLR